MIVFAVVKSSVKRQKPRTAELTSGATRGRGLTQPAGVILLPGTFNVAMDSVSVPGFSGESPVHWDRTTTQCASHRTILIS